MRIVAFVFVALAAFVFAPSGIEAKTVASTALFATSGRSLFNSGPAITFDTGTQRLGPGPVDLGDSVGDIVDPCPVLSCKVGAKVGAELKANIGVNYGVKLNSGSFDAQYPVNLALTVPDDYANIVGTPFTLKSSYDIAGYNTSPFKLVLGQQTSARLQSHSPTIQAFADLDARFSAFIGAQACAVVCVGPALNLPEVKGSRPLASVNRNNDGVLRIGDTVVNLNQTFTALDGNLTARLNIPNIDAVSGGGNGSTAGNLKTYARDDALVLDVNVGNVVSKALGIPLVGNFEGIGYNLLSANAGLAVDVRQTLSLTVTPYETYNFLTPVRQVLADGTLGGFTKTLVVPLGQDVTLRSSALNLGVVPVTSLVATLSNVTDLVVQGNASVQALAANIFGLNIGPLYDSGDASADLFSIPLFDDSFNVPFAALTGLPFNVRQGLDVAEFYTKGAEVLLSVGNGQPSSGSVTPTQILARDLDCPPTVACFPQYRYYADGNPVTIAADGSIVFLGGAEAASLTGVAPGIPTTDATQLVLLQSVGFTGTRPPFVVPEGAPNPFTTVPEPGTWMMLLVGFCAVGSSVRSQRRNSRTALTG